MRRFERFEYSVTTEAAPGLAWDIFSDWTLWPHFSDLYQEIRWVKGKPWHEGSRLSISIRPPIGVTLDHVIISCVPGNRVAWIDHAVGTSLEQWVYFDPQPEGGTLVRTWAEFTGMMPVVAGQSIKDLLTEFSHTWYTRYALECDRVAASVQPFKKQSKRHHGLQERDSA